MDQNKIIEDIIKLLQSYLFGEIQANQMIHKYNNIITQDDFPWEPENDKIDSIDEFQNELGFYVEDPDWRNEYSSYYGKKELKKIVKKFIDILKK